MTIAKSLTTYDINNLCCALSTHRQKTPTNESEQEPSDDNEDDWSYQIEKVGGNKKMKKDKSMASNSPRRGANNRGPGRPSKHIREPEDMSSSSTSQLNLPKVNIC